MTDLAGQIEIRLDVRSGAVAIGSSRPLTAARIFVGKSPAEVVRQLPILYSLCGTAQAAASVVACEQALGAQPSAAVLARRQALVQAETIKEHLWRLLLDWPTMLEPRARPTADIDANANVVVPAMTMQTEVSAMPRVMRAFMALRQAQQAAGDPLTLDEQAAERGAAAGIDASRLLDLVIEQALGAAPADWLEAVHGLDSLQRWAGQTATPAAGLVRALAEQGLAGCGANAVARLPSSPGPELARRLASAEADAFIAEPQWRQQCAETGPLARVSAQPLVAALLAEHGNGLLTRLGALLVELAQSASRLETLVDAGAEAAGSVPHPSVPNKVGIGTAEAARGRLMHRVSIAAGRVDRYQILAPTEWNFHPRGAVAQGLAAIARSGAEGPELERLARLYITAVDPCVEYQLSVS